MKKSNIGAEFDEKDLIEGMNKQKVEEIMSSLYIIGPTAVLREILSNARSAIEIRAKQDKSFSISDGLIQVFIYPSQRKIIITDNGIGMTKWEWISYFRDYGTGFNQEYVDIGGQFGIGSKSLNVITEVYLLKSRSARPYELEPKLDQDGEIIRNRNNIPVLISTDQPTKPICIAKKQQKRGEISKFQALPIVEKLPIGTSIEFIVSEEAILHSQINFERIHLEIIKFGRFLNIEGRIIKEVGDGTEEEIKFGGEGVNTWIDKQLRNRIHETIEFSNDKFEIACDFIANKPRQISQNYYSDYIDQRKRQDPLYDLHPGELKILLAGIPVENYQIGIDTLYNGIMLIRREDIVTVSPTRDGIVKDNKFKTLMANVEDELQKAIVPIFSKFSLKRFMLDIIGTDDKHELNKEYTRFLKDVAALKRGIPTNFFKLFIKDQKLSDIIAQKTENMNMTIELLNNMQKVVQMHERLEQFMFPFPDTTILEYINKYFHYHDDGVNPEQTAQDAINLLRTRSYIDTPTFHQLLKFYEPLENKKIYDSSKIIDKAIIKAISYQSFAKMAIPEVYKTAQFMHQNAYEPLNFSTVGTVGRFLNLEKTSKKRYLYYTKKNNKYLQAVQEGYDVAKANERQIPIMHFLNIRCIDDMEFDTDIDTENKEITIHRCRKRYDTLYLRDLKNYRPYDDDQLIILSQHDKIPISFLKQHLSSSILVARPGSRKEYNWILEHSSIAIDLNDFLTEHLNGRKFISSLGIIKLEENLEQIKKYKSNDNKNIIIAKFNVPELIEFIPKDTPYFLIHCETINDETLLAMILAPSQAGKKHQQKHHNQILYDEIIRSRLTTDIKQSAINKYEKIIENFFSGKTFNRDSIMKLEFILQAFGNNISETFWDEITYSLNKYDEYDRPGIINDLYRLFQMLQNERMIEE